MKEWLKNPYIILLGVVIAGVMVWKFGFSDTNTLNSTLVEENEQIEEKDISYARTFGVIQSDYLSDQDFQEYIGNTIDEVIAVEREDVIEEALKVVEHTNRAINELAREDSEEALEEIETALGKLQVVLTLDPNASLVPVTVASDINSLLAEKSVLEADKNAALLALQAGNVQLARSLLESMESEVAIETVSIPLESHGVALRAAVKLIDEGKLVEAREVLRIALNTLVLTERIVPIPLLNAELLVDKAAEVVDSNPEEALGMLVEARDQVEIAELLGYGYLSPQSYVSLYADVTAVEAKINDKQNSDKAFEELQSALEELRVKISQ